MAAAGNKCSTGLATKKLRCSDSVVPHLQKMCGGELPQAFQGFLQKPA